jgi:hypothetical protein
MKRIITACLFLCCIHYLVAQVPTITDFNPKSGDVGSIVTITGTNFSTTPANNIVFFGATKATVTAATTTQLTVTVPNGVTISPVSVAVNGLTGLSSATFIPAFRLNRGNLQPDVSFYSQQSISVPPINPILPALSDFDGDGKTDIVYTSYTLGNIYLSRNISTGQQVSFAPFVTLSSGTSSTLSFLKVADIDGDNKPDIISCTINTVFIWKNKSTAGSILFDSPVSIALDSRINGVRGLEIADFNKDGKIDILTANSYRQTPTDPQRGIFSLLRNTSSGSTISFGANTYITGTSIPSFIALADVEQDNQTEIVVYYTLIDGSNSSGPVTGYALRVEKIVFSGNNFSFNSGKEILTNPTNATVTDLKTADINGDDKPEILVSDVIRSNATANVRATIFSNTSFTGNIAFNSVLDLRVELADPRFNVSQLAIADIDGDGKLDILITIDGNPFIGFLYNRSTLNNFSFLAGDNLQTGITLQNPIAGDLNNDNKPEIVAGLSGRNLNGVLSIILNGTYIQPVIQNVSPTKGNLFSTINISGSNFSGIASENVVTIGNIKGIIQNATPNQLLVSVPAGVDYQPITVNVAQRSGYAFQPFWATFSSDGNLTSSSFTTDATLAKDIVGVASKESVIMADIDSDGKTDIVAASNPSIFGPLSIVNVFRNTSTNATVNFQTKTEYEVGQDIRKMLVTDLNNDTKLEIITLNTTAKTISILRNTSTTGNISFAPKIDLPFDGSLGIGFAVGDLNLDGKPDIAYTSNTDNGIVLMINNSTTNNLTFIKSTIILGQNNPNVELAIYDIDGDNKPEVISNGYGLGLIIFRNLSSSGTLNFASAINFTSAGGPLPRLAIADLNADNKPDIITASGSNIRLFPNNSTKGNISLGSPIDLTITGTTNSATSIAITDLDGNGKPDLIFDDGISIFRNQSNDGGSLSFSNLIRFIPNGILASVADINADGKPDFIIRNTYNLGGGAPDQNNISYLKNIVFPALPTLQSVSPATGSGPGRTITLTGTNLTEVLSISFAGVNQPVFSGNPDFTQLTAIVPDGATSGNLVVTTRGGTASIPFTAIDPASFITGNSTVCPTQKNLIYSVPAVSGASGYEWTVPAGITIVKGNTTNSITVNLENTFTGTGSIRVRGTFGTFKGENSPTFNVSVATIPNAPANLQAKIAASGTVALTWEDKSTDETEFFIYRSANSDTAFILLGKTANNLINFTDNFDLRSGTTYFYKIAAANGECLSTSFSNTVGITTPPPVITALSELSEKNIIISPNPSDGIFEIVSERALSPKTEIWVSDALGKILWKETVKNSSESGKYTLNLQNIASGIYFLTIKTEKSNVTKKIIRQ